MFDAIHPGYATGVGVENAAAFGERHLARPAAWTLPTIIAWRGGPYLE
jgi:hypothetical protein